MSEQDGCHCTLKRLAVILGVLMLHGSLWTSHMYFNVHVTSMNGTQVIKLISFLHILSIHVFKKL